MEPTSAPAHVIADTIVRTVELGVRITDAAVHGETTVVFCDLIIDGPGRCPGRPASSTPRVRRCLARPPGEPAPRLAAMLWAPKAVTKPGGEQRAYHRHLIGTT